MTWSRFAQSLIAALVLSSLTVACGKSDRKEKISLRTGGGANGKVVGQADSIGAEKESLAKASEKLKKSINEIPSTNVKDSDVEKVLDETRDAKALKIEELPAGKYRLTEIQNSLFITNVKSQFKGLQIFKFKQNGDFEIKPTVAESVQNEHALKNFKDDLAPQIIHSEFSVLEDQAAGRALKLDQNSSFIFAGVFNANKSSAYSIEILEGEVLFDSLSSLNDTRKARFGGSYTGPEDKAKKLSSYFKITQISETEIAIIFSTEVGAADKLERVRNLVLIYNFQKIEAPALEGPAKSESPAAATTPSPVKPASTQNKQTNSVGSANTETITSIKNQAAEEESAAPISADDVGI